MGSLDLNFLKLLKEDYRNYDIFLELGTSTGETIFELEKYFNELYTIEISEILYNETKNKSTSNKINFILGDSTKVLINLLPKINKKTIIFLDSHYSGGRTSYGNKQVPLIEELVLINTEFKQESIIIIDDMRIVGKKRKDWENLSEEKILNTLKDRILNYYYLPSKLNNKDRLIINISKL